jgi:hypothetical protein
MLVNIKVVNSVQKELYIINIGGTPDVEFCIYLNQYIFYQPFLLIFTVNKPLIKMMVQCQVKLFTH